MSKESNINPMEFRFRHLLHRVEKANSGVGPVLVCMTCDVVNITDEQKKGSRANINDFDEWYNYHYKNHGGKIWKEQDGSCVCICGSWY